ncbi:MAG: ABC transporter ATP-binding protein/permease [Magnetospirillum sp. WYHS-4]
MIARFGRVLALFDSQTRWRLAGMALLMALAALLEMAGVGLFLPFIQVLGDPSRLETLPVVRHLYAALAPANPTRFLLISILGLALFYLGKNAVLLAIVWVQNRFVLNLEANFARRLMAGYLGRPYLYHLSRNQAEILRNVSLSVMLTFTGTLLPILTIVLESLMAVAILGTLLVLEPLGTLAVLTVLGSTALAFYGALRKRVHRWGGRLEGINAELVQQVQGCQGAIKEILVLGCQEQFVSGIARLASERSQVRLRMITANQAPRMVMEAVGVGVLLLLAALLIASDRPVAEVVPLLGMFSIAAFRLLPSINRIVSNAVTLKESGAAFENVCQDLETAPPLLPPVEEERLPFRQEIVLRNVGFTYPGADRPALEGINIDIRRGQEIGLVGPSGSGKSTLVDILLGLCPPATGTVEVDGRDLRHVLGNWQKEIGYVPQRIHLLNDSLRRNVALGVPNGEIDDAQVWRALALAQVDEAVRQLPEGLDTVLGDHGQRLSGGQRQRIGIARALYRDPEVLVMDEATSALDNETEHAITRMLSTLHGEKTIVIIAHRLNTVRHCDHLILMCAGRVTDVGRFGDLAQRNPDFQRQIDLADLSSAMNSSE